MSFTTATNQTRFRRFEAFSKRRFSVLLLVGALLAVLLAGCTGRDIIGAAEGWTPVAVADDIVYSGTRDGDVMALDSKELDRDERTLAIWEYVPREENQLGSIFGTPAVSDTHVYLGSTQPDGETGRLLALRRDRQSNSQIQQDEWEKDLEGAVVGGPVLTEGRLLVGSEDGRLYCFDAATGDRLWTYQSQGLVTGQGKERRIWSPPAVADGIAYFGAMDGYLYAVSVETGEESWKFKTNGAIVSNPLVVGNAVIFGSFDRTLYALDKTSGSILWTFSSESWFWAGAVSNGETVYVADMGGQVYALPLDRRDGDPPEWVHEIGYTVNSTPVIVDDSLVVAAKGGNVSLLDIQTGTAEGVPKEFQKDIRAPLVASGTGELARVYFGDSDGVIRALDIDRWRVSWAVETRE